MRVMLDTRFGLALALAAALVAGQAEAQTPIPPEAADFAMGAAQSDQYEIQAAYDAETQSQDPRIRTFAQQMVQDHARDLDALRQAATASGLPAPPAAMSSDQAALLSTLQSLRGARFDQAYIKQQMLAHDQALAVAQSYAAAGADPTLRKAAQSAVPMIQHHLDMAQQLSAARGGA